MSEFKAAIMLKPGTLQADHLTGRAREGKPVTILGARWYVKIVEMTGVAAFDLERVKGDTCRMCSQCGSFDWEQDGHVDEPQCAGCRSKRLREG